MVLSVLVPVPVPRSQSADGGSETHPASFFSPTHYGAVGGGTLRQHGAKVVGRGLVGAVVLEPFGGRTRGGDGRNGAVIALERTLRALELGPVPRLAGATPSEIRAVLRLCEHARERGSGREEAREEERGCKLRAKSLGLARMRGQGRPFRPER